MFDIDNELENIKAKFNSLKNENYNLIKQNVDPITGATNLIGKKITISDIDNNEPTNEVLTDVIKELHISNYHSYILTESNKYYNTNLIGKNIFFPNEGQKQYQEKKITNREFIRNLKDDEFDMYLYSLFVTGKLYNYIDEGTMYFEDFQEYMSREHTNND